MKLRTLPLTLALLVGSALGASAQTLYFSAIPDEDETRLVERFSAVADYLEGELGVDVQFVPVKSYAASVTAFRNNQIQLAWFGGLTGVQARLAVPDARAIAQGKEDPIFVSYFIANTETGLEPSGDFPEEARGMSFTFGAKTSTSGRLMPEYHIRKETGEAPEEFFGRVGFSGDHSQTLRLVASGAWQVGALNFAVYDKALEEGAPEVKTAKVIWETPPYPDYNWTIRGDVDATFGEGFADKVQDALIGMDDPELLNAFPREAFIPAQNADFEPIAETAKELGLIE
ncbi:MAG: putative selenate ABC transporter substrate-binding protein [Rhodobacteraceae bacterium]|jgi:phosphonate transport system substrate-binding protein|uniref:Phosphonate transport system substrate-binding protein n=1 Tax=Salipiger profundus TaxID=1229727 RepID=A0A1U7D4C6_9RHOB|nr:MULTISPECIES: putative selenate ABC transporter substrate-binding protein [Salipiger]APX22972.1 phosphonate transport system substrate-binding protein [Salipiger profundus]MAB04638.1 putative selenate ABC transporter substrate-binding protein [Paracoccaceae bacterium]GGA12406.1 putative selenate ABC transporter substrate-binding protein [Salipiger profundus]SFD22410.1 phosphonate transport system substrate-binding protein [Salipiger profundus]